MTLPYRPSIATPGKPLSARVLNELHGAVRTMEGQPEDPVQAGEGGFWAKITDVGTNGYHSWERVRWNHLTGAWISFPAPAPKGHKDTNAAFEVRGQSATVNDIVWLRPMGVRKVGLSSIYPLFGFEQVAGSGSATNSGETCLCTWTGTVNVNGAEVTAHTSTGNETWYLFGNLPWLASYGNSQSFSYSTSQMNLGSYVKVLAKRPASGPPYITDQWKMIPFTWPCFLRPAYNWQAGYQGQFFFAEFQLKSPVGLSNQPWKPQTQFSFFYCADPLSITTQPTAIDRTKCAHGAMACTQETGWIPISRVDLHPFIQNVYSQQATAGFFQAQGMGPSMGGSGQFGTSTGGVE